MKLKYNEAADKDIVIFSGDSAVGSVPRHHVAPEWALALCGCQTNSVN